MAICELPRRDGGWPIIYADPAWQYRNSGGNGAAENHYRTMSIEQICALPVREIAAENAALFLWGCYPLTPEAFRVIDAWGFKFKTLAFQWIKIYEKSGKPRFGNGFWTHANTEPCWLAFRGKMERVARNISQIIGWGEIVTAPITAHSAKPPIVRDRIVELLGDLPRLELFARGAPPPGWTFWGNEVQEIPAVAPMSDASAKLPCQSCNADLARQTHFITCPAGDGLEVSF